MIGIWTALIGIGGTIIGTIVAGYITYFTNKKNSENNLKVQTREKMLDIKTDNVKFLLKKVYGPIMLIYEKDFSDKGILVDESIEEDQKGLAEDSFKKIKKIVDNNYYLISREIYLLVQNEKVNGVNVAYLGFSDEQDQKEIVEIPYIYDREYGIYNAVNNEFRKCRKHLGIDEK